MKEYEESFRKEQEYLNVTLELLKAELKKAIEILTIRKNNLIQFRKQMWEDTPHSSLDMDQLIEIHQYLTEANAQTVGYRSVLELVKKYETMVSSPYFGRFDFKEKDVDVAEKIYIGLHSLMDPTTQTIVVYDWRAPICSIFYQYELGEASYESPMGKIYGDILMKRQYKILDSKLQYFFDCSVTINDEILQKALSTNTSPKMKSIVETIQKEQDEIIRNINSKLIIVQGVAGSGKTSVALHRVAFLVYEELDSALRHKDILIISPNPIFSTYISNVLPELGEKNVEQIIFEDFVTNVLNEHVKIQPRNKGLEFLASYYNTPDGVLRRVAIDFKGSEIFMQILDRLVIYFKKNMIEFEDIYYNGKVIETRQNMRNMLLNSKLDIPIIKKLEMIETLALGKIRLLRKGRIKELEAFIKNIKEHQFEVKQVARLMSLKESKRLVKKIKKFLRVNFYEIYVKLFSDKKTFFEIAKGLDISKYSDHIETIIEMTNSNLKNKDIQYEDCAPILYLKYKLEGCKETFPDIKHVIIDEAQDYSILQYNLFKLLFKNANFTILGDIEQSIEFSVTLDLYDKIISILNKQSALKVFLNKSYRSSYEIFTLSQKILGKNLNAIPFKRHENKPVVLYEETVEDLNAQLVKQILECKQDGYESIGVLCKTALQAENLYQSISNVSNITLIIDNSSEIKSGTMLMPIYMAKGLEFDAIIIYNISNDNFSTQLDRRLLYVACSRALHRLILIYTGARCGFIDATSSKQT